MLQSHCHDVLINRDRGGCNDQVMMGVRSDDNASTYFPLFSLDEGSVVFVLRGRNRLTHQQEGNEANQAHRSKITAIR